MSAKTLVRIVLVSTAAASLMSAGSLVTSAHAGDFYTRKRVNGVWMTGRFAKHHPVRMAQLHAKTPTPTVEKPPQRIPTGLGSAGDDLAPAFQRALQARRIVSAAPTATVAVPTNATNVSFSDEDRLLPLRRALEARARMMATTARAPNRAVKAVTFNFETGLRTSIYNDGSVIEEHFNPDTTLTGSIIKY
jgi:hypothetical protein